MYSIGEKNAEVLKEEHKMAMPICAASVLCALIESARALEMKHSYDRRTLWRNATDEKDCIVYRPRTSRLGIIV